ncbi:MAG: hypothetical protein EOM12_14185, partial [Verrucomicrobiae bacterium]|nr:hypothetical protein [Verrucomicrobiae bacterium]
MVTLVRLLHPKNTTSPIEVTLSGMVMFVRLLHSVNIQLPKDSFYNTGIATYVWVVTKEKDPNRVGQIQLIDASKCYEPRRKSVGSKRVDITNICRELIVQAYGEFKTKEYEGKSENGSPILCSSKVLDSVAFGYNKITVESPLLDEQGKVVLKKGKPAADTSKRDTE